MKILLERLTLEDFEDGLEGLLRAHSHHSRTLLAEPFWLQDDVDGKCFGPAGFSECGDATLWLLRQDQPSSKRRILFPTKKQTPSGGLALQLVDMAGWESSSDSPNDEDIIDSPSSSRSTFRRRKTRTQAQECLVSAAYSLKKAQQQRQVPLTLGSCASEKQAWKWRINGKGVLYQDHSSGHHGDRPRRVPQQKLPPQHSCVSRVRENNAAVLSACDDASRVRFSLVRYQIAGTSSTTPTLSSILNAPPSTATLTARAATTPTTTSSEESPTKQEQEQDEPPTAPSSSPHEEPHLPRTVDLAHSHATVPVMHTELKQPARLLFSPHLHGDIMPKKTKDEGGDRQAVPSLLKDASPVFVALGSQSRRIGSITATTIKSPLSSSSTTAPTASTSIPHKVRKIPTHPYIAASNNEVWVDPQTGLEFLTDLCRYLGHERKESGRHTLVGVGQYTRTVFNIKVYGIAFYVSKRDVLADPSFESYASLTTEELRERPDFYAHLRKMPSSLDQSGGLFDRTLLVKLNMQLSTDTMRSSLHADWSMLTEERKSLLIDSSLKSRPADENMLQFIKSDENPGRCSCGQTAPEEYNADISCCARGTELVFTWRKNGDVEIRLDGRLMDIFPRPDVAEGIFFEYLRYDDPISPDLKIRAVDGFPFLLAPLAQVKGVHMDMVHPTPTMEGKKDEKGFLKAMGSFTGMLSSQAGDFSDWIQHGATGVASHVGSAAKLVGDSARGVGEEMDRRRVQVWSQMTALPEAGVNFITSRRFSHRRAVSTVPSEEEDFRAKFTTELPQMKSAPRGRVFRFPATRWFGEEEKLPDEIEPMIHPTMTATRNVCLTMVHLYLLLLLIVSFPGTQSTRTRLVVVKRAKKKEFTSDTDSESTAPDSTPVKQDPQVWDGDIPRLFKEQNKLFPLPRRIDDEEIMNSDRPATNFKKSRSVTDLLMSRSR